MVLDGNYVAMQYSYDVIKLTHPLQVKSKTLEPESIYEGCHIGRGSWYPNF